MDDGAIDSGDIEVGAVELGAIDSGVIDDGDVEVGAMDAPVEGTTPPGAVEPTGDLVPPVPPHAPTRKTPAKASAPIRDKRIGTPGKRG
jgi:hypothetical protein